ncbi:hypothetical protein FSP39_009603 [Pinctada imbricata]|uniref:Uncharacterized protein n=1 Tax=Pinctada imbricata TaxID=66713 RepID=A0AA89C106_PINIB|nr:hypothetical protein FSP39_009603 [Pinctada imbricata]
MCMSTAIDSRLEFEHKEPIRYTLLLGMAFPTLKHFTISFWIRLYDNDNDGAVFSYRHNRKGNVFRMMIGNSMEFDMWQANIKTNITMQSWKWYHVIWTWSSTNGEWAIFIDNTERGRGKRQDIANVIPNGGHFVLGQSYEYEKSWMESAFLGDLAHMNIWNEILNAREREEMYTSCNFMYCGNVVQWADFRKGTRGAMKLRWPSGIISAQCNMEIVENIVWVRTPAVKNLTVPCPGQEEQAHRNDTYDTATRTCQRTQNNEGVWSKAYIDECVTEDLRTIKLDVAAYLSNSKVDEEMIIEYCKRLQNHTLENVYSNPIDVATVIDVLEDIIKIQALAVVMETETLTDGQRIYKKTVETIPTFQQIIEFSKIIISTVNSLLKADNDRGWNAIRPQGVEGDTLLKVMEMFADVVARGLEHHVHSNSLHVKEGRILVVYDWIEFKIEMQHMEEYHGYLYPDSVDRIEEKISFNDGSVQVPRDIFSTQYNTSFPDIFAISSFRYMELAKQLPNHNIRSLSKDDHVNTPVIAVYLHINEADLPDNFSEHISFSFPFLDVMCRVFAVLIHYFVLCNHAWLMNEAFNQYIVITYSAHSHGELTDSGSMFRYYFLGWSAALHGIVFGCWLDQWSDLSRIHMKGLWIQIILVTVAWSFAFLSLQMHDSVIKYLYALMNTLQIQAVIKSRQKAKKLVNQTYEADDPSMESFLAFNIRETLYQENLDTVPLAKSPKETKDVTRRRKPKALESEEEVRADSDCEMVTTV